MSSVSALRERHGDFIPDSSWKLGVGVVSDLRPTYISWQEEVRMGSLTHDVYRPGTPTPEATASLEMHKH